MDPFPTPDPSLVPDMWQQYTVAVRQWQGDLGLLLIFVLVTIGCIGLFWLGVIGISTAAGSK